MSDKRKRCERCGSDLTIYKKILSASNLHYNNGLARAKVRDLSGAITALHSSLELNKLNTNARNLLGLIFYEMGETVAALSEWVISKHFQPGDNDADEYINKVQSNPTKLDAVNQAIKRYNTALTFAKQKNEDLAIIQLKKVTTLNPHFIRAYHLLALLYMKAGENEKAKRYLIKAGRIDVSNTTTLRYMRELEPQSSTLKDSEGNPEAEQRITSSIMPISSYREDKPNIIAFVNLVIGVGIGLALMAFLVIPTIKKNLVANENSDYVEFGSGLAQLEEKENTIVTLQSDKDKLNKEIEQLQTQLDNIEMPEDSTELYNPLFETAELYLVELEKTENDRDYIKIADTLATIDESQMETEAAINLLNRMKEATYPSVAQIHYDNGHDFYSDGKYDKALEELEKAIILNPTDVNAIYFTARSYHRLENLEKAALFYNTVVTDYPDSSRVTDAKEFLKQVQE
jgi:tetratricopeptide (TPR) repeat protein